MEIKREIILELEGEVKSKKNQYRRGRYGGMYKPKEVVDSEESILGQIKEQLIKFQAIELPFERPVEIMMFFEVDNFRKDFDNQYTTLQDILVKAKVIKNDNPKWVVRGSFEGTRTVQGQSRVRVVVREI